MRRSRSSTSTRRRSTSIRRPDATPSRRPLQAFVDDCIAEGEIDVDDLEYYGTRQAVEDLEAVRTHLGVEQMTLYGESYGTQFVQTYAAAHPDRVAALIVDGVVDLTVDWPTWYHEAARAYDDALTNTFQACDVDDACAFDMATSGDGDPVADAYDALAARLADGPIEFEFPMPDGSTETRELTASDLEIAASGNVGSFTGRMHLLRVLNAAAAGNYMPLDRMADQYVYLDPETQEVVPDPSWSDALYYAVECQDYSFFAGEGTPRQRLDAVARPASGLAATTSCVWAVSPSAICRACTGRRSRARSNGPSRSSIRPTRPSCSPPTPIRRRRPPTPCACSRGSTTPT